MDSNTRIPKQKRAIEKREKIIESGFKLMCEVGYYNTNTAEIAKKAGVSTGIVYQYFSDKHDILIEGLKIYGDEIFFPILTFDINNYNIKNFDNDLKKLINNQIKNHKLSKKAHEEISAMTHLDKDIADVFYQKELETTEKIKEILVKNKYNSKGLNEKIHITMGLIDNLCHEIVYHKHKNMNYEYMINITIKAIKDLFIER